MRPSVKQARIVCSEESIGEALSKVGKHDGAARDSRSQATTTSSASGS